MGLLVGPSYLSRLWCVVEIFTFVHMGGDVSKVTLLKLTREDHAEHDEVAIRNSVKRFDGQACHCFSSSDKDRMLRIIRTAFGDMNHFNIEVRALMTQIGFEDFSESDTESDSDIDGTNGEWRSSAQESIKQIIYEAHSIESEPDCRM